ncbi:MAG: MOSC domain-containing protein [Nocardioidaceae bacterium]
MNAATAAVTSVNTGVTVDVPWGTLRRSAIDKRPATGPVGVGTLGLEGDEIADLVHHGGPHKAVYAFAGEDLRTWAGELGKPLRPGQFGENLTTTGIDVTASCIGDRWRIGTAVLEVATVRIPCSVFAGFIDERQWVRRFVQKGRPGAYLRVIEQGHLSAGDEIHVIERRGHDVTVGLMFRALTTQRELLPRLVDEPRVPPDVRETARRYLDGLSRPGHR